MHGGRFSIIQLTSTRGVLYSGMKKDNELNIVLGTLFAIVLGIVIGYACAVHSFHREAVANRAGHWEIVSEQVEFAWGAPQDCEGR